MERDEREGSNMQCCYSEGKICKGGGNFREQIYCLAVVKDRQAEFTWSQNSTEGSRECLGFAELVKLCKVMDKYYVIKQ